MFIKRLTLCFVFALSTIPASACPGDFDGNREVNFSDFLAFTSVFGKSSSDAEFDARMDLNGNGSVDFSDFLAFTSAFGTDCPDPDRDVLVALYNATDGANWTNNTNWLTDNDLSTWYGVSAVNGKVTGLYLEKNNLSGTIPPELGKLTNLEFLDLNLRINNLSGTIPSELGQLTNLKYLFLEKNNLSGTIPSELGQLTNLAYLYLEKNNLSGTIPSELGQLTNLRGLSLGENNLSGSIPSELGQLTNLTRLYLGNNNLSGTIPSELGQLTNLENLSLGKNNLSGTIPSELGQIANLASLSLGDNNLSGSIPPELGQLTNLEYLSLDENNLSGTIPAELGQLTNLEYLYLYKNYLSGTIPSELGQLTNLKQLYLRLNNLSGSIPSELGQLTNLENLSLDAGLYVIADAEFQAWLKRFSIIVLNLPLYDRWPRVYLTQATQSPTQSVPLLAGDVALLRVFVAADKEVDVTMPPVRATFYQNGTLVHTTDISSRGTTKVPQENNDGWPVMDLSSSANAEIPGLVVMPGLEMVVEIDPDGTLDPSLGIGKRIPETGRMPVDVKAVPPLNLTLVPFLWQENPDHSLVTTARGLSADDDLFRQTRDLLPVHDFNLSVREPVWTSLDPVRHFTIDNSMELLNELKAIHTMDGASGHYMGILRSGGSAHTPGTTFVASLHAGIIAHELGHNLSLRHAPCDNTGQMESGTLDPSYPYTDGNIGVWGYDFRMGTLVAPGRPDLMSYCGPHWTSDYNFKKALEYRLSEDARPSGKPTATRTILLWGGVNAGRELFLEPTFVVTAPPALPNENGPYLLTGEDVAGSALFSLNFGMPEIADGDGSSSFVFALPVQSEWPEKLARIVLSGPEGVVTMGREEDRAVALLRDRTTGRVRGILRNWSDPPLRATRPTVPESNLEVVVSRGVPSPAAWRR